MATVNVYSTGFACPVRNFVQYLCCGTENDHYCCSPEPHRSEVDSDQIYIAGQYQPTHDILYNGSSSFVHRSYLNHRQFEQFQKLFLPIFLLTSSILFLVGIAIWFWLYKHKVFYALDRDEPARMVLRTSTPLLRQTPETRKRDSINLTTAWHYRRVSCPSTEV